MKSRYDYMKESCVQDTDGENFPDTLSVSYNDVQLTQIPTAHKLTQADIEKFWLYMYNSYGLQDMDDILLNINGIPYIGAEKPGEILFKVTSDDLYNFENNKIETAEE